MNWIDGVPIYRGPIIVSEGLDGRPGRHHTVPMSIQAWIKSLLFRPVACKGCGKVVISKQGRVANARFEGKSAWCEDCDRSRRPM